MLTIEEHRVAAKSAENYPPDHGGLFLAIKPVDDALRFMLANITAAWLRQHPEDATKG
jgi:hypothetical protein